MMHCNASNIHIHLLSAVDLVSSQIVLVLANI